LNKLHCQDIRFEAYRLYKDVVMESEFVDAHTPRERALQQTLDEAAEFLETIFEFTSDEHFQFVSSYRKGIEE